MANLNVQMNMLNESGKYDVLYPEIGTGFYGERYKGTKLLTNSDLIGKYNPTYPTGSWYDVKNIITFEEGSSTNIKYITLVNGLIKISLTIYIKSPNNIPANSFLYIIVKTSAIETLFNNGTYTLLGIYKQPYSYAANTLNIIQGTIEFFSYGILVEAQTLLAGISITQINFLAYNLYPNYIENEGIIN